MLQKNLNEIFGQLFPMGQALKFVPSHTSSRSLAPF